MKQALLALALLATPTTPLAVDDGGGGDPCVKDGEVAEVEFDQPPLGESGDPTTAEYADGGEGRPQALEHDYFFSDAMGPATPGSPPTTASVPIRNTGGNLSGPNGVVQNGFGEGDCIEVYVRWRFVYQSYETLCAHTGSSIEGGPVTSSSESGTCTGVWIWRHGFKSSKRKTVCPC